MSNTSHHFCNVHYGHISLLSARTATWSTPVVLTELGIWSAFTESLANHVMNNGVMSYSQKWGHIETTDRIITFRVCGRGHVFVVSVCLCVCWGYNFWTSWHRNFIFGIVLHLGHIYFKLEYQGYWAKVKVISWENGNFATWTSVKLSLTCVRSKVIPRSRSFHGQILSFWLSISKREVGLRLKGILVLWMIVYLFVGLHKQPIWKIGLANKT